MTPQEKQEIVSLLMWIINCLNEEDMDSLRLGLPEWLDPKKTNLIN